MSSSSCAKKAIVDIDILVTSWNGNRKIMQSIRIMSIHPSKVFHASTYGRFREI